MDEYAARIAAIERRLEDLLQLVRDLTARLTAAEQTQNLRGG